MWIEKERGTDHRICFDDGVVDGVAKPRMTVGCDRHPHTCGLFDATGPDDAAALDAARAHMVTVDGKADHAH